MPLPRPQRNPSLLSNIQGLIDAQMYELHTALPATVESYDAARGLVNVQPSIKSLKLDPEGERVASSVPVIVDVPLQIIGAGGARQTFPVQRGDFVWLIFSEASLALWKARGVEVDPEDERRHHIHDAVALLGVRPPASPWTGADTTATTWGIDGGLQISIAPGTGKLGLNATDALLKGTAFVSAFNTWRTALNTYLGQLATLNPVAIAAAATVYAAAEVAFASALGGVLSVLFKVE